MESVGIIAEYNPFHNGHQYHIEKAKELTGADTAIVIMSGNFTQRGTPAIMPKHLRTQAALLSGASLVIELPVCFSTGSAEIFAYGAVSILEKLGCVDTLCFGSECGDITLLQKLSHILSEEPDYYKERLNFYLRQGNSFPTAREHALHDYEPTSEIGSILSQPNNILGIEYLKALHRLESTIKPYTIKRISSHYHDKELQEQYSSASAIREVLSKDTLHLLEEQMPSNVLAFLKEQQNQRYPITANDFSVLLKHQLLKETCVSLCDYADVSEELANRIHNHLNEYIDFEQFCACLKTKEITYARISRALLHILLGIRTSDCTKPEYARILGFRKADTAVLSEIKKHATIPLISKLGTAEELSSTAKHMLETDIYASNLYESVLTDKFKTPFINEYEHSIVRI